MRGGGWRASCFQALSEQRQNTEVAEADLLEANEPHCLLLGIVKAPACSVVGVDDGMTPLLFRLLWGSSRESSDEGAQTANLLFCSGGSS